jgi:antitoxin HicB
LDILPKRLGVAKRGGSPSFFLSPFPLGRGIKGDGVTAISPKCAIINTFREEKGLLRTFRVILEPNETGGYTVTVPMLPGCISEGDTKEEALANIKEAIELYIESLEADGEPVPSEDTVEEAVVEVAA